MEDHVVLGPPGGERGAAGAELTDQVGQVTVVRVPAGFGAEPGDDAVGGPFPVGVELVGPGVEEREPGGVAGAAGLVEHRREQGVADRVGSEDVATAVADLGRRGDAVEHPLKVGSDLRGLRRGGLAALRGWARA